MGERREGWRGTERRRACCTDVLTLITPLVPCRRRHSYRADEPRIPSFVPCTYPSWPGRRDWGGRETLIPLGGQAPDDVPLGGRQLRAPRHHVPRHHGSRHRGLRLTYQRRLVGPVYRAEYIAFKRGAGWNSAGGPAPKMNTVGGRLGGDSHAERVSCQRQAGRREPAYLFVSERPTKLFAPRACVYALLG